MSRIVVEGRVFEERHEASANLSHVFAWDRKDALGRKVYGLVGFVNLIGHLEFKIFRGSLIKLFIVKKY